MRFFFYGTLIDPEVRDLVLGRLARAATAIPATLGGWRAVRVYGRSYPALVRVRDAVAEGVLVAGLPREALDRLVRYEGPAYDLVVLDVEGADGRSRTARVFVAGESCRVDGRPWSYADWCRRDRKAFIQRLRGGLDA